MKKILVLVVLLGLLIGFSSQLSAKKKTYLVNMKLVQATRDPGPGTEIIIQAGKSCQDDVLQMKWMPGPKDLDFELLNKAADSIAIIWEESFFIDKSNIPHRVTHSGIKPENMEEPVPPLDISPGKKIKDMVYPYDYFFQKSKTEVNRGLDGTMSYSSIILTWEKKPVYEKKVVLKEEKDFDFAGFKANLEKETFEVRLTVKAGEKKYLYHFYFKPEVAEK